MGGMVAQHLAVLLLRQGRLASLYVAVTTGGHWAQPLMKYFPTWCLRQVGRVDLQVGLGI